MANGLSLFGGISLVLVIYFRTVSGRMEFQQSIPNGNKVPNPCSPGGTWAGVGHQNPYGGGLLNPFGAGFKTAGSKWTQAICKMDSDGDGKTNGEELGDPNCSWTSGAAPSPPSGHPGICEPITSTQCAGKNGFLLTYCPNIAQLLSAVPMSPTPRVASLAPGTCSPPPTPAYAFTTKDSSEPTGANVYLAGDCIIYACVGGYNQVGNCSQITCQDDGSWSPLEFTCRPPGLCPNVTCNTPPIPQNSLMVTGQQPTGVWKLNDMVTLGCATGFNPSGNSVIRCVANNTWSPTDFACKSKSCVKSALPPNSRILSDEKAIYNVNDTLDLGCVTGYMASGSITKITCLSNTGWSPTDLQCQVTCDAPMVPQNAKIVTGLMSGKYPVNSEVTFACNTGYQPSGSKLTIQCTGVTAPGSWTPSDLTCVQSACPMPTVPANAVISEGSKQSYNLNDQVTFSCNPGYQPAGNTRTTRCMAGSPSNTWSPSDFTCVLNTCPTPVVPNNALIAQGQKQMYAVNDQVTFACMPGFQPSGNMFTIRCTQGQAPSPNSWTNSDITCKQIACLAPTVPSNAIISSGQKASNTYNINDSVTFSCVTGYTPSGSQTSVKCLSNGLWSTSDLTCQPIVCKTPTVPGNAMIATGGQKLVYQQSETVTFVCNSGYSPTGANPPIKCQVDGTWTPSDLTCRLKPTCTSADYPKYSTVVNGGSPANGVHQIGDSVQYGCVNGYTILGTIQCRSDGSWSGYAMTCQTVTRGLVVGKLAGSAQPTQPGTPCPVPNPPVNSTPLKSSELYVPGEYIEYLCNPGYFPTGILSCLSDGSWSAAIFTCTPSTGGSFPPAPAFPIMPVPKPGPVPAPGPSGQAVPQGSSATGMCSVPRVPANAQIIAQQVPVGTATPAQLMAYPIGSFFIFHCNDGYLMAGPSDTILCVRGGLWTDSPTCTRPAAKRRR